MNIKKGRDMITLINPKVMLIQIAIGYDKLDRYFVKCMIDDQWIIVHGSGGRSYMFSDTGLFGHTNDITGWKEHSYRTSEEAIKAFKEFYPK